MQNPQKMNPRSVKLCGKVTLEGYVWPNQDIGGIFKHFQIAKSRVLIVKNCSLTTRLGNAVSKLRHLRLRGKRKDLTMK